MTVSRPGSSERDSLWLQEDLKQYIAQLNRNQDGEVRTTLLLPPALSYALLELGARIMADRRARASTGSTER